MASLLPPSGHEAEMPWGVGCGRIVLDICGVMVMSTASANVGMNNWQASKDSPSAFVSSASTRSTVSIAAPESFITNVFPCSTFHQSLTSLDKIHVSKMSNQTSQFR